jgi:propionate CoA-transferase
VTRTSAGPTILTAPDWVARIPGGATIALTGSGGGILGADAVFTAIESLFLATGHPRDLTVVHALGIGDGSHTRLNRFAHHGMVARVIGGHWCWSPHTQDLVAAAAIEAYALPSSCGTRAWRDLTTCSPSLNCTADVELGQIRSPRRREITGWHVRCWNRASGPIDKGTICRVKTV